MTNDDKQSAFPCCGNPETDHMVRGMDLRDWFADAGYLWFLPLPDDFEVWEVQKENISSKIHDKG